MKCVEVQRPTYEINIGEKIRSMLRSLKNALPPMMPPDNGLTPQRRYEDRKQQEGEKFAKRIGNKLSDEVDASKKLALNNQDEIDLFNTRLAVHVFDSLWGNEWDNLDAWGNNATYLVDYMVENRDISNSLLRRDTIEDKTHKRALDLAAREIVRVALVNQNRQDLKRKILNRFSTDETNLNQDPLLVLGEKDQEALTITCEKWRKEIAQHRPPTPPPPRAA